MWKMIQHFYQPIFQAQRREERKERRSSMVIWKIGILSEAAPPKQNSTKTACHRHRFIDVVKSGCDNEFRFWNVNSKLHTWKQIRNFLT